MNWSKWVRQTHRWLSIVFTVGVIVNLVAVAQKKYTFWVGLLALLPLASLLFTGLYLFVLPYATKWGSGRRTGRGTKRRFRQSVKLRENSRIRRRGRSGCRETPSAPAGAYLR